MIYEYIFWKVDTSFSFQGPFGIQTQECYDKHGFAIDIDVDNIPKLETLEGFGAFADVEDCKTYEELYDFIEENKKYVSQETDEIISYTTLELLLELQSLLIGAIKQDLIKNKKAA